jgi:single-strand DNA-binding protein
LGAETLSLLGAPRKAGAENGGSIVYENSVHLIGFLGADAQSRTTRDGVPLTLLSLATKRSWKDRNGEWQSQTEWHHISCFAAVAEFASNLRKGAHLYVSGYLRSREIEKNDTGRGKSSGAKARAWEVRAIRIAKLDRAAQEDPSHDIPADHPTP